MSVIFPAITQEAGLPSAIAARRERRQASFARSFAQIVAVFMRDRNFRTLTIAELEWLVLPPIMVGQFALAHAPTGRSSAEGREC